LDGGHVSRFLDAAITRTRCTLSKIKEPQIYETRIRTYRHSYAFALLAVLAFQTSALAQDKAARIDQMISLYQKYSQVNGSALVADNGKVIYKKGSGLANMEWNIPNASDTKFRLGSVTKQFTATLILQLVEQGKNQTRRQTHRLPAGLSPGYGNTSNDPQFA